MSGETQSALPLDNTFAGGKKQQSIVICLRNMSCTWFSLGMGPCGCLQLWVPGTSAQGDMQQHSPEGRGEAALQCECRGAPCLHSGSSLWHRINMLFLCSRHRMQLVWCLQNANALEQKTQEIAHVTFVLCGYLGVISFLWGFTVHSCLGLRDVKYPQQYLSFTTVKFHEQRGCLFWAAAIILRAAKKNPATSCLGPLHILGLSSGQKHFVHFVPVTNKCWSDHILGTVLWSINIYMLGVPSSNMSWMNF